MAEAYTRWRSVFNIIHIIRNFAQAKYSSLLNHGLRARSLVTTKLSTAHTSGNKRRITLACPTLSTRTRPRRAAGRSHREPVARGAGNAALTAAARPHPKTLASSARAYQTRSTTASAQRPTSTPPAPTAVAPNRADPPGKLIEHSHNVGASYRHHSRPNKGIYSLAPARLSMSTTSRRPCARASASAVWPSRFLRLGSAPCSMSSSTMPR